MPALPDLPRRAVLGASLALATLAAHWPSRVRAAQAGAAAGNKAPAPAAPPVARRAPVTDTLHGTPVTDPYRWMEDPKDPDWRPFLQGQAAWARARLDALPGRAALARRVSALAAAAERVASVQAAGARVFVEKRPAGANSFKLFVRDGLGGTDRLLVDPEARAGARRPPMAINYWLPSPDGRYVLYGMSEGGSEQAVIEVMDVAAGRILPERIDRAVYGAGGWLPDGTGFFYNRLAEGAQPGTAEYRKDSACWLHALRTDPKRDVKVLARGQFADVPATEIDVPAVFTQPGSGHAVGLMLRGVQRELAAWVAPLKSVMAGRGEWRRVCGLEDQVTAIALVADDLFLIGEQGAPRGRVLHVKAGQPAVAGAREVMPQGPGALRGVFAARDAVYVESLEAAYSRLHRIAYAAAPAADAPKGASSTGPTGTAGAAGRAPGAAAGVGAGAPAAAQPVALPYDGALTAPFADPQRDGLLMILQGWVQAEQVWEARPGPGGREPRVTPTALIRAPAIDLRPFVAEMRQAVAPDGTRVPVSMVYRRGQPRDGRAPTLVTAYGAYGVSMEPAFSPRLVAWLERGGVWATAHVRGGGEFGREWHAAGRQLTKPNSWRDLIACCELLVAEGWTRPERLTISGGSAGGIVVGMAMTERPELFAAVISDVGVSNPLRAETGQTGPANVPEFGSVETADGFRGLFAMDPYHHVRDGKAYPGVLLTTGANDARVEPWQAGKMAARLQAANPAGRPVLLRVAFDAGHGAGATRQQVDAQVADAYAFALWQSGDPAFQPKG